MSFQEVWNEYFESIHSIPFISWNAKEGQNLNRLVKTIQTFWKVTESVELDEDESEEALRHFLKTIRDEFVLNALTPSIVYSQVSKLLIDAYSKRVRKPISETVIKAQALTKTPEQLEEEQRIREGYERLKMEVVNKLKNE